MWCKQNTKKFGCEKKIALIIVKSKYHNDLVFGQAGLDPEEEQSDQGLHCLPICLHLLDPLLCSKMTLFQF